MTRLEKYLLASASEMIRSEKTASRYFKVNNITIRLSDHVSIGNASDIQIITPVNKIDAGLYTVMLNDTKKILIWNLKQIKEFLPSLMLIKEMNTKSVSKPNPARAASSLQKMELAKQEPDIKEPKLGFVKVIQTKLRPEKVSASERLILLKGKSTWNTSEIQKLSTLMHKEFNRGDSINDDFQIFLNCNSLSYNDVLNIYKIIVIDNEEIPTIELLQEAYSYIK